MVFFAQKEDSIHNLPGQLIGMVSCNPWLVNQAGFTFPIKGTFPAVKTGSTVHGQFSVRAPTHAIVFALSVVLRLFTQPPKQISFSIDCPVRSDISTADHPCEIACLIVRVCCLNISLCLAVIMASGKIPDFASIKILHSGKETVRLM